MSTDVDRGATVEEWCIIRWRLLSWPPSWQYPTVEEVRRGRSIRDKETVCWRETYCGWSGTGLSLFPLSLSRSLFLFLSLTLAVAAEKEERSSRARERRTRSSCRRTVSYRTVPYRSGGGDRRDRPSGAERSAAAARGALCQIDVDGEDEARQHEETILQDRQHVEGTQQLPGEGVCRGPPHRHRRGGPGRRYAVFSNIVPFLTFYNDINTSSRSRSCVCSSVFQPPVEVYANGSPLFYFAPQPCPPSATPDCPAFLSFFSLSLSPLLSVLDCPQRVWDKRRPCTIFIRIQGGWLVDIVKFPLIEI